MDVRVSIIVTAHNYGRFLRQCLASCVGQHFAQPFEVVLVDDGSSDNTEEICREYERQHPDVVRVIHLDGIGLSKALNVGLRQCRGEYIVRLDADDYFDERLLLLEVDFLDRHPEIGMVYPDHFRITSEGVLIDYVKLPRVGDEVTLLDGNPIPSGSMYRCVCYETIGGYNEALRHQEDFDFWIKFIERYGVHNLPLPLVYYRKHQISMSTNLDGRMAARRFVKRRFVEDHRDLLSNTVVAIIPAMGAARVGDTQLPLRQLGGKSVLAYSIEEARKVTHLSRVLVSTEDPDVAEAARALGAEVPYLRPAELASSYVPKRTVVAHMLRYLKDQERFSPDLAVVLPVFTPLRRAAHIREAIDTMCIYHFDSVIGVVEDLSVRWKPGAEGLQPIGPQKRVIKHDKETTYRENGALYVVKSDNLFTGTFLGDRVGYIEMFEHESVRLETEYDFFVAEALVDVHGLDRAGALEGLMGSMDAGRRVLAVIPARGGSKEVPGKNLREVDGKPLVAYMIEAALGARHVSRTLVSTDSPAIAEAARRYGAEVPFMRPAPLATDEVPLPPVMRHAMEFMDQAGFRADHVMSLQPTSPLTLSSDLDAAIEKAWETGCSTVVSLKKVDECHPWRAYRIDGDRVIPFNEYTNEKIQQRQDRPPAYKFSGAIYVRRRELLEESDGSDFALGPDVRFVFIPAERAIDVNSPLDLLLLKAIMAERKGVRL